MNAQENIDEVIEILKSHCCSCEQFEEWDLAISNNDTPDEFDAFAYDNARCVLLLGGELEDD